MIQLGALHHWPNQFEYHNWSYVNRECKKSNWNRASMSLMAIKAKFNMLTWKWRPGEHPTSIEGSACATRLVCLLLFFESPVQAENRAELKPGSSCSRTCSFRPNADRWKVKVGRRPKSRWRSGHTRIIYGSFFVSQSWFNPRRWSKIIVNDRAMDKLLNKFI